MSIDPLRFLYPFQSPYVFAHNNPILLIDYLGLGAPPKEHVVKKGDTCWGISEQYDVSLEEIYRLNPSINKETSLIRPGDKIILKEPINKPEIITREQWNAKDPIFGECEDGSSREFAPIELAPEDYYTTAVVHHAGNNNSPTITDIQDKHQGDMCKADIGYHFAIDLEGNIYEGRPLLIKGAHCADANTGMIGIVMLADFDDANEGWKDWGNDNPTAEALIALAKLVAWLNYEYGLENGVGGHKDINCGTHTQCPGNLMDFHLFMLRNALHLPSPKCVNFKNQSE